MTGIRIVGRLDQVGGEPPPQIGDALVWDGDEWAKRSLPPDLTTRVVELETIVEAGTTLDASLLGDSLSPFRRADINQVSAWRTDCWHMSTAVAARSLTVTSMTLYVESPGVAGTGFSDFQMQLRERDHATNTLGLLSKVTAASLNNITQFAGAVIGFNLEQQVTLRAGKHYALMLRMPANAFTTQPQCGGVTPRFRPGLENPYGHIIFSGYRDTADPLPDTAISMATATVPWTKYSETANPVAPMWWSAI